MAPSTPGGLSFVPASSGRRRFAPPSFKPKRALCSTYTVAPPYRKPSDGAASGGLVAGIPSGHGGVDPVAGLAQLGLTGATATAAYLGDPERGHHVPVEAVDRATWWVYPPGTSPGGEASNRRTAEA